MKGRFPILWPDKREDVIALEALGCPRAVSWERVEPHAAQALRNHDQTLQRLAERGGLSPAELYAVLTGLDLRTLLTRLRERKAQGSLAFVPELLELLAKS